MSENVMCADDIERPAGDCVQDINGNWQPSDECVTTYNGEWIHQDVSITLCDGEYAHEDDDEIVCRADGECDYRDNCSMVGGDWYCDNDVTVCDWCGETCLSDDTFGTVHGDSICSYCYENDAASCECCGDVHPHDELDDEYRCPDCQTTRLVRNYSDRSANYLRSESSDKLLFGIELEVEDIASQDAGAEFTRESLPEDYCVLKDDGSLGPGGFEIVTRPDSMAVHKRHWDRFFDSDPSKRLRSWDTGRCGMHVHITRSALSQLQIGKMLCFLNEPNNSHFVQRVAGRDGSSWARRSPKKLTDATKENKDGRYVALNLTCRTAEMRIFKGTIKRQSFYKNLEFVSALVSFCSPANASITDSVSHLAFCEWLDRKSYPNLWEFLSRKGFVKE